MRGMRGAWRFVGHRNVASSVSEVLRLKVLKEPFINVDSTDEKYLWCKSVQAKMSLSEYTSDEVVQVTRKIILVSFGALVGDKRGWIILLLGGIINYVLKCIVAVDGEREKRLPDKLQLYNFPHQLQRPMRYDTRLSPIAEA